MWNHPNSSIWFIGPEWLAKGELETLQDYYTRRLYWQTEQGLLTVHGTGLSNIIDASRYSSLARLLRVTAYVLQFIDRLKTWWDSHLYSLRAEVLWITEAQSAKMSDRKMNERKKQLGLFLDNSEMWRCEGRLANADLHYDVKCPMILHCDHHFTSLVVKWEHHQVLHKVMRETVTELKNRYWS
jgi:hypothetical protein